MRQQLLELRLGVMRSAMPMSGVVQRPGEADAVRTVRGAIIPLRPIAAGCGHHPNQGCDGGRANPADFA